MFLVSNEIREYQALGLYGKKKSLPAKNVLALIRIITQRMLLYPQELSVNKNSRQICFYSYSLLLLTVIIYHRINKSAEPSKKTAIFPFDSLYMIKI